MQEVQLLVGEGQSLGGVVRSMENMVEPYTMLNHSIINDVGLYATCSWNAGNSKFHFEAIASFTVWCFMQHYFECRLGVKFLEELN